MIVAIDASVLLYLVDPSLSAPLDEAGNPIAHCAERLEHLLSSMSKNGDRMLVPTPSLAEALVHAGGAGQDWLAVLHGFRAIRVAPFDERAAIECAVLAYNRSQGTRTTTRAKAKFDEQIVAIALAEQAEMILSDDGDIRTLAPSRLVVKGIAELELPPEDAQGSLL